MTSQILKWIEIHAAPLRPKRILDVGSRNINGSPRSLFPEGDYRGVDICAGPDVDEVLDAHRLEYWGMFDMVLCLEMLEHDDRPWETVDWLWKALKTDGHLVISTPTGNFPEHRYPIDMLRFNKDAYTHWFFKDMKVLHLDRIVDDNGNPSLIGMARKIWE